MKSLPEAIRELYPFTGNFYETLWGKLHYLDEGEGDAVILLHGNPTWSFFYRDVVKQLAPQLRCIVPDHLGCGLSNKPQNGFGYRLTEHIDNIVGLIDDHLQLKRYSLVVHDWGGAIGMGVALRYPDRVKRIQILNTAAFLSSQIPLRIAACRMPLLGEWVVRGGNAFALAASRMCTTKPLPKVVREGFLYPYDSWKHRIATHRFVVDIPMRPDHPTHERVATIEAQLPQLRDKPMQICWGMRDWCFTPAFLERWCQLFPQARVLKYPNAAHYLLEDAPEAIDAIKAFLTSD